MSQKHIKQASGFIRQQTSAKQNEAGAGIKINSLKQQLGPCWYRFASFCFLSQRKWRYNNTCTWIFQFWFRSLWVTHLLSRATLLPRTQLSCSWTHSAVLCKSAARPAVGGGLGLLWLASELRLRDVMDGCCLCGGGAGGRGGGPCWLDRWSPEAKQRETDIQILVCVSWL